MAKAIAGTLTTMSMAIVTTKKVATAMESASVAVKVPVAKAAIATATKTAMEKTITGKLDVGEAKGATVVPKTTKTIPMAVEANTWMMMKWSSRKVASHKRVIDKLLESKNLLSEEGKTNEEEGEGEEEGGEKEEGEGGGDKISKERRTLEW